MKAEEEKMTSLSDKDRIRYSRQIMMEEIGEKGQEKLKAAHVVVAGAGGLGSASSIYMAAAGIGKLTIIDPDEVELSNLNRQILHWENDIGKPKIESAVSKLRKMNSSIEVNGIREKITNDNVMELLKNADAVVDGLDNFTTRFIVNRAAVKLGIPFFHGACHGFQGRVATIIPGKTPCLECFLPQNTPDEKVPVLGATPGMIGALQASEVIKYFLGLPCLVSGKLLIYDSISLTFEIILTEKDPLCKTCGMKNS